MRRNLLIGYIVTHIVLVSAAMDVQGDVVLSASSVVAAPPVVGAYSFDRTIDQSGLVTTYVSGVTDFDAYVGLLPIHLRSDSPENFAASPTLVPQNVDYDLGSSYGLQKLAFWNYPFEDSGGVVAMNVFTANEPSFSSAFFAGTFFPVDDGDGSTNEVQVFDLADSIARFVRLRVTGQASPAGIGFSEVAFGVVPEPLAISCVVMAAVTLLGTIRLKRRPV